MGSRELKQHCALDESTMDLLRLAMTDKSLSARAYNRILKAARTIADLALRPPHCRPRRRNHSISVAEPADLDVKQPADLVLLC